MGLNKHSNLISIKTYIRIKENIDDINVDVLSGKVNNEREDKDGYLWSNVGGLPTKSHHIVACLIFGERMVGKQINHIDGNKNNNKPMNLEIVTASENVRHAFEIGLKKGIRGNDSTSSKITEKDVLEIRKKRELGITLKNIGEEYGLSFQQVSRICKGERWGHVGFDWSENMADLDFEKYEEHAHRTANSELSDFDEVANYSLGIVSEASEVSDEVKKELYHGHDVDVEKIKDELGDTLWYMTNLAKLYGLTLGDIARHNVKKLTKRYKHGFSEEASRNRKE